jgi:predicted N-acetyltransferase YhbS
MRIDYLADHPEAAPLLAAWHYREWEALLPEWSLAQALAELESHTGRRRIPTTFVAVEGGLPVGSASLLEADLDGWAHLTPWLASVYVIPEHRGRGVGRKLVARAVEEARALAVPTVYLFTAGQQAYYERLGWVPLRRVQHHRSEVVIMDRQTSAEPAAAVP